MSSLSQLSVKQLNQVLRAKASQLSPQKGREILQRRSLLCEKEALLELCREVVLPSELEQLLQSSSAPSPQTSSSSTTSGGDTPDINASHKADVDQMANMTPEQLSQQAQAMRQNPSAFSFMQSPPLSVQQVLQTANQMEQMAQNPVMFQQWKEQMARMSPEDIKKLKELQQGNQTKSTFPSSNSQDVGDMELESIMRMLNAEPAQARAFIKSQPDCSGLSDSMIDQQLDTFRKMDPAVLRRALEFAKPWVGYYQKVNNWTGGRGKYVLIILFLVLCVISLYASYLTWNLFWACWGYLFGGSHSSSSSTDSERKDFQGGSSGSVETSTILSDRDEFEF